MLIPPIALRLRGPFVSAASITSCDFVPSAQAVRSSFILQVWSERKGAFLTKFQSRPVSVGASHISKGAESNTELTFTTHTRGGGVDGEVFMVEGQWAPVTIRGRVAVGITLRVRLCDEGQ